MEVCTILYALLFAKRHRNFQRLFITARRNCSSLEIEKNAKCHINWFFKFYIQPGSAKQQWNVCRHKMDESSSILLGYSYSDKIQCIQQF